MEKCGEKYGKLCWGVGAGVEGLGSVGRDVGKCVEVREDGGGGGV